MEFRYGELPQADCGLGQFLESHQPHERADRRQARHADNRGVINSAFKVFVATHHITAEATDPGGTTSQPTAHATEEPNDQPPTAAGTLVPLRNPSPPTAL